MPVLGHITNWVMFNRRVLRTVERIAQKIEGAVGVKDGDDDTFAFDGGRGTLNYLFVLGFSILVILGGISCIGNGGYPLRQNIGNQHEKDMEKGSGGRRAATSIASS